MAAMAPALTDTPAEARHIRFKLASPSSTLSPGSTENNSNASNILISDSGQEQEPLSNAPSLGKLATYLCSDVKPLPSSTKVKESLKLQGVLIKQSVLKSHGLLSGSIFPSAAAGSDFLLRKRHTLELTRGQLKSLVNGAGAGSTMVPVNGLSKKVAVPSAAVAEKGSVATVNGDSNQPSTNGEALLSVSSKSVGTFATGDVKPQQNLTPSVQGVSSHRELTALSESMEVKAEPESPVVETNSNNIVDCPLSRNSSPVHDDSSLSTPNLEALLRDRAQQSQHRQTDIEGRLLRLRKRLQVVQAKQVQRHFKQQLTGFLDRTLTPTSSRRADQGAWRGTRASVDTHAHNLSQFLKGGRVASELEQLHLSGTTYLRATEAQFDSDATESSSGGESDIEEEELGRADVEQQLQRVCVYIYIYIYIYIHIHYIYYFSSVAEVSDTCLSSLDSSCTSARTRPLLTCRRRRLIHPNTVHNLNGKVRLVSFSPPSVCEVNGSCIMCGSTPPLSKPDLPFNRPLLERVAHQDRSIHPVLSMQSDVALSLQLKKVLRSHWQTRPFDRIKSLKKISLKHKLSITPASSFLSKHKFRLIVHSKSEYGALVRILNRAHVFTFHSCFKQPVRRRRGESPFDINNIVIPMSVAATTRVEKLQYKEILTPRWREVDILAKPLVEDLSEGAFAKLHQTLEDQERSRWRWTALAPAKRRGSRYLSYKSLDGRTTPSIVGTNPSTPQPSSPDASHFHLLQDYGPVPSPLSPPSPDTPCSRDAHTPHTRDAHRLLYSEDTCGSTSDCTFEEMVTYTHSHASFMIIILLVFSIEKNFN
uniref:KAT8 regulatory NSL complex subunit 1-like n=1 Tax=Sinocyclocheilus rhinocerous TaxID=307959 RepID=A0A673MCW8_9TELE